MGFLVAWRIKQQVESADWVCKENQKISSVVLILELFLLFLDSFSFDFDKKEMMIDRFGKVQLGFQSFNPTPNAEGGQMIEEKKANRGMPSNNRRAFEMQEIFRAGNLGIEKSSSF